MCRGEITWEPGCNKTGGTFVHGPPYEAIKMQPWGSTPKTQSSHLPKVSTLDTTTGSSSQSASITNPCLVTCMSAELGSQTLFKPQQSPQRLGIRHSGRSDFCSHLPKATWFLSVHIYWEGRLGYCCASPGKRFQKQSRTTVTTGWGRGQGRQTQGLRLSGLLDSTLTGVNSQCIAHVKTVHRV